MAVAAALLGWIIEAFDFFVVPLALPDIAQSFNQSHAAIAATLTVALALRPAGAWVFGLLADRWGRKPALFWNLMLSALAEVGAGFAPDFATFIFFRALFGLAMGGEWGVSAALAMESAPARFRGLVSGVLQTGFSTGYFLAAGSYLLFVPAWHRLFEGVPFWGEGWRLLFWIGGSSAFLALLVRRRVPETLFLAESLPPLPLILPPRRRLLWFLALALALAMVLVFFSPSSLPPWSLAWVFPLVLFFLFLAASTWKLIEGRRSLFFYFVCLIACLGGAAHGSKDVTPTFLRADLHFTGQEAALVSMVASLGSLVGGPLFGALAASWGCVRAIALALALCLPAIPLWLGGGHVAWTALGMGWIEAAVAGAWAVMPLYYALKLPPRVRGLLSGLSYQVGILLASFVPWAQMHLGQKFSYAPVLAATMVAVVMLGILIVFGEKRIAGTG